MNPVKPIKRSTQLSPLSREHHDGLLFSWKLSQGLKKNIEVERMAAFTGWYWKNHMRPHFFQEENILKPCLAGHPLAEQMKKEHDMIRELVISIDQDPDRADIRELSVLLLKHIRFEERELFPAVESLLTREKLEEIHGELEKHSPVADEWKDIFWAYD